MAINISICRKTAFIILIVITIIGYNDAAKGRSGVAVALRILNRNCACTGRERTTGGPGPRTFQVSCAIRGGANQICTYSGNPHDCAAYNNNGQERFYQELLNANGATLCRNLRFIGLCPAAADGYYTHMCGNTPRTNFKLLE